MPEHGWQRAQPLRLRLILRRAVLIRHERRLNGRNYTGCDAFAFGSEGTAIVDSQTQKFFSSIVWNFEQTHIKKQAAARIDTLTGFRERFFNLVVFHSAFCALLLSSRWSVSLRSSNIVAVTTLNVCRGNFFFFLLFLSSDFTFQPSFQKRCCGKKKKKQSGRDRERDFWLAFWERVLCLGFSSTCWI